MLQGDYNQYECGLTVANARAEDGGEWECDFESYVKVGEVFLDTLRRSCFLFFVFSSSLLCPGWNAGKWIQSCWDIPSCCWASPDDNVHDHNCNHYNDHWNLRWWTMQRFMQNSNICWIWEALSFLVCLSDISKLLPLSLALRPNIKKENILKTPFPWLIESVPSQEKLGTGQSARWTVSRTQTMQLTTRSLKPCSVSLQFLSIFLSVDCRKADYFRQICSQLPVFSINLKELQTERIIPVSGGI